MQSQKNKMRHTQHNVIIANSITFQFIIFMLMMFPVLFLAFMPQPGGGNPGSYLPYPASSGGYPPASGAFPPYPTSNFGGFPAYPGASGSTNPPTSGYPPYMPNSSGYNNFYGGVSSLKDLKHRLPKI